MKLAFDAQLLFEKQKTGIGRTAEYILNNLTNDEDIDYYLNYFSLKFNKKCDIDLQYEKLGYKINKCGWFHNYIYRKIYNVVPAPYSIFFGKKAQITQFFNYDVPPGVNGKSVTFVYDMVYKACPETVSRETMRMLKHNLVKSCERADHIITISEFSKMEIIKYMNISEKKISIMPCGVDLTKYHNKHSKERVLEVMKYYGITGEYILYLGTLEPRKNLIRLIEAYALLTLDMSNPPKLVIAGKKGWMYENIFEKVEEYSLSQNVIFTDYVDENNIPILIQGAVCFVFPSIYEGFGLPPLEAMACGTPVIVSNKASLPEVVGNAGYYVDPYSITEIKNAMEKLLCDVQLRDSLRKKGLDQAKKYTWKASVGKLIEIYKELLK